VGEVTARVRTQTYLPDICGAFPDLRKLWLDMNRINELPKSIGRLCKLEELWLYRNRLTKLPEKLQRFSEPCSVRLDLRRNRAQY
jgi:Leucine-rich repeat (LRR) protein